MDVDKGKAVIAADKLTEYLLTFRPQNDKSKWLNGLGYTFDNKQDLEHDIMALLHAETLRFSTESVYGDLYFVEGLIGIGRKAKARAVWMYEYRTTLLKFITLYPAK